MTAKPNVDELAGRAVAGDRRALARLLTLIDDDAPGAHAAVARLAENAGRAWVLGITGVPGSGKSTLVDALLGVWLGEGHTVAVVAIDPSSPVTGGAVLGDRVRMGANAADERVFIRSFSARDRPPSSPRAENERMKTRSSPATPSARRSASRRAAAVRAAPRLR